MIISKNEKNDIQELVANTVQRIGSQNRVATTIGVSAATLSEVLNDNWDKISNDMWRKVASGVGYTTKQWNTVETRDYKLLTTILNDALNHSACFAITGNAGSGKSKTFERFENENKNVILISCNEFWNRKYFLVEVLRKMGVNSSGMTVVEMMTEVIRKLKTQQMPLIILDEADKLTDQVLYFFITLYNHLEDKCGIILAATDHLEKRVLRGIRTNKKGFNEIYSRIGRRFIALQGVSFSDVKAVCEANGISGQRDIKTIFDDCDFDLRRVKRKVHAIKLDNKKGA